MALLKNLNASGTWEFICQFAHLLRRATRANKEKMGGKVVMEIFLLSEVMEKKTVEHTSEVLGSNSCLLAYYSNMVVCECW